MPAKPAIFNSSRLKLARAAEHIDNLEAAIASYFTGKWYSSTLSRDANGQYHFSTTMHGEPRNYRLIVGDAIHNMRAALDFMAVELVKVNGGNEKGVCFPFSADAAGFEDAIKSKKFHQAVAQAQALLRAIKPYKGGNDFLRALHDLDIQDKHHKIEPSVCMLSTPAISVVKDSNGKPVGFVTGDLQLEIDNSQPARAVFTFPDNGPLGGKPVIDELRAMHALITSIVDRFEAICP